MKSIFISTFLCVFFTALSGQEILLLKSSGKVVIGDTTQIQTPGNYNLYVQNGILTERVKVALKTTAEWADNAFENTPDIQTMAMSIAEKKHLFDMPSADELVENGYELKAMDARLLQQIEWLWQHVIRLDEENKKLKEQLERLAPSSGTHK
jgi:trimeric autotransporter adhesin